MRKTITLSNEIDQEIKKLSRENEITQSQVIEYLLREALNMKPRRFLDDERVSNNTD
mgnify:CR=1 FL=1